MNDHTKALIKDDYKHNGIFPSVDAFHTLVRENLKPGIAVAEIGVFDGATTRTMLKMIKDFGGTYYAIDWFNGTDESKWGVDHTKPETLCRHHFREDYDQIIYPLFLKNIQDTGCADVCKVIKAKSIDAAKQIPDFSLDICFIDAAHDYDNVRKDIAAYLPKLKIDGILAGHDYDNSHLELMKAVNDVFGAPTKICYCNSNQPPIWIKTFG